MKFNILSKIKKFILSKKLRRGALLGGILSFFIALKAKAALWGLAIWGGAALLTWAFGKDILKGLGLLAAWSIAQIVQLIAGAIIILELKILTWVTSINTFSSLPIVQHGWRVTRDLSYIFFIVILLVIAIGTILGLKEYGAKNTLWKVVVMAILINFSLMIGGTIIDFTQVIFNFFLMAPLEDKTNLQLSYVLANQLQLNKLFEAKKENTSGEKRSKSEEALNTFGKYLLIIVFSFVMVIVLGALIGILVARALYLWILLIFAPLAWMFWALPLQQLKEYSSKWWSKFIDQAIKGPVVAFFIFLAISMSLNLNSGSTQGGNTGDIMNDSGIRVVADNQASPGGSEKGSSNDILFEDFFEKNSKELDNEEHVFSNKKEGVFNTSNFLSFFITALILFAGIGISAQAGGIAGKTVGMIKNMGSKAGAKLRSWGKTGLKTAGQRTLRTGAPWMQKGLSRAGGFLEEKLPWVYKAGSRITGGLRKTPLGVPFVVATRGLGGYVAKNRAELVEKKTKDMDYLSSEVLKKRWQNGRFSDIEKMAAGRILESRNELSQPVFNELDKLYKKNNMGKERADLNRANPHLSETFGGLALNAAQAQKLIGRQNFNLGEEEGRNNLKQRVKGAKDENEIMEIFSEIIAMNYGGNAEMAKSAGWTKDRLKQITGKEIDVGDTKMRLNISKITPDIQAGNLPQRIKKKVGEMFKDIDFGKVSIDFEKDVMFQEGSAGYNFMANVASGLDGDNLVKLLGNIRDPEKAKNFLLAATRHAKGETDAEKIKNVNSLWNSRGQLDAYMGSGLLGYTMEDVVSDLRSFETGRVSPRSVQAERYDKLGDRNAEFERKEIEKEKQAMRQRVGRFRKKEREVETKIVEEIESQRVEETREIKQKGDRRREKMIEKEKERQRKIREKEEEQYRKQAR